MRFSKKRGAREIVWGPEEPWVEPKKEIVAGPAADLSDTSTSEESALGFLGTMAGAAEVSENSEERPKPLPYGWEPSDSSTSSSLSSSSYNSSSSNYESSDNFEKIMRLQRKIDNLVERIEALERKRDNN